MPKATHRSAAPRTSLDALPREALAVIQTFASPSAVQVLLSCLPEGGPTVLARIVKSLRATRSVQRVAMILREDQWGGALEAETARLEVPALVGTTDAALRHLLQDSPPDQVVVLVGAEAPLLCPEVVDRAVATLRAGKSQRIATDLGSGVLPAGLEVVAVRAGALLSEPPVAVPGWLGSLELGPAELGVALRGAGRRYVAFDLSLREPRALPGLAELAARLDQSPAPLELATLLRLLDDMERRDRCGPRSFRAR